MGDDYLANRRFDLGRFGTLLTGRVFHRYPGKRALLKGELDGVAVVAKFYVAPVGQAYEWYRGLRGTRALLSSGVAAPALYYAGYRPEVGAWLTVQEWVEADEPWPPEDSERCGDAHARLILTLAEHHRAGIVQNDLNWLNFIPRQGRLYAVDGDRVRRLRSPLNRKQGLAHLVRLYASKTRLPEATVRDGFRLYLQQRQWLAGQGEEEDFITRVRRARRQQAEQVARRACRGWKHYPRLRHDGFWLIRDRRHLDQSSSLRLLAGWRREAELKPAGGLLELDGQAVRWLPIGVATGFFAPLRPWLVRRAAFRIWVALLTANRLGLGTERHLALVWPAALKGKGEAAVMLQSATGVRPLADCLSTLGDRERSALQEQLNHQLALMQAGRITLVGNSLNVLGWDGRQLHIIDATAVVLHSFRGSAFARHWHLFRQQLQAELAAVRPTS
ncbi:Mn2+dependent serine/threonine protein kinase [Desulfurivibrio alkaliphilus]|uniref:Mn2+dependent serine/threonine protein kinase n=1 Tax=Desulfurivibrio alkaliphilus (strain DSM 19089 / UNIQEM U267 / AHT2) TaxID=589865 RepID=D6Z2K6_DESAT|nr:Mn2+dependent serine/threonine protein kinase [Desulfurivibrio alkaliphilus]ADH85781.1 Mn2+dependent serine/threonine protein kinase [Desulfurivibrio alkaliphilus AHT 2]